MDISQVGASGAVVVVVLLFLKYMREEAVKRDASYRDVSKSLDGLAKTTSSNTKATQAADQYLRDRNGRDKEMHQELILSINAIPEQIIATAGITAKTLSKHPQDQTINTQKVETQVVKNKGKNK